MPFASPSEIPKVFLLILNRAPDIPKVTGNKICFKLNCCLLDLFDYIGRNFIASTSQYYPSMWSCSSASVDGSPRTTNSVEAHHKTMHVRAYVIYLLFNSKYCREQYIIRMDMRLSNSQRLSKNCNHRSSIRCRTYAHWPRIRT